jgi:hypothetical protein
VRRLLIRAAAGLAACLTLAVGLAEARDVKAKKPAAKEEGGCGDHGTAVHFFDTPQEAATKAKKEEKLVFVLHVSGMFEKPEYT